MKTKLMLVALLLLFGLIGRTSAITEPVKITGLHVHGDTAKQVSYLEGNVRLVQGSTVITTAKATVYIDKKQVLLEGGVKLQNSDGTVNANSLEYDFRDKSGTFRGKVILRRKASRDKQKKTKKDPFTLYAEELFLETKTNNFTAIVGKFEHKDFKGTADRIIYDDSGEIMILRGNVDVKKSKGEALQGDEIRIGLQDKSFQTANRVSVQMEVDEGESDKSKREPVKATGDTIRGDTEKKVIYLEGNVRIVQGLNIITTDKATIDNGPPKRAIFEKHVKLENSDGMVEADSLDYDLRKKSGSFQGNVVMRRKASQDSKGKAKKDPFTLRGVELFLETKTKNFTAIKGYFQHKDFNGSADQIIYHDALEELIFRGRVDLKRAKGENVSGEETRIYLKDKSFVATNNVKIQIDIDDDPEDQPTPGTTASPKKRKKP
jgi:lipopolysaccharide export system protein LptA